MTHTMYRATYQRTPQAGSTLRGMTYCASGADAALAIARDWQMPSDRLLTVKALRPLNAPLLELTP